jgi:hypothetical protein
MPVVLMDAPWIVIERVCTDCADDFLDSMEARKHREQVGAAEVFNRPLTHSADNNCTAIRDRRDHGSVPLFMRFTVMFPMFVVCFL